MKRPTLPIFAKYLFGIALVQAITALLAALALKSGLTESWLLALALALAIGSLAAFWFAAVARRSKLSALAKVDEKLTRRQADARRRAERSQARAVDAARRQTARETKRNQRGTNRRLWTALAGVSAAGVVLLFTQFMWLGLVATAAVGGTAVGYGLRVRQQLPKRERKVEEVKLLPAEKKPALTSRNTEN